MEPNSTQPNPSPKPNNTGMAILAYLGILVIIPLLTEAKNDPFVKFHIKQGLVMLVFWVLGSVVFWVPVFGWLLWLAVVVLTIIGISNAHNGRQKELPVVGHFASNFNI